MILFFNIYIMKKDKFVKKSKEIHDNLYDYSLVEYINNKTKVKIICPEHGIFEQRPDSHTIQKHGCPKCSKDRISNILKKDIISVIDGFNIIQGNKYDYTLVEYNGSNIKVKIICPEHGTFEQTPHHHLRGSGCPICALKTKSEKQSMTLDNFVNKSKNIHGDNYSYDKVEYINNKTKVTIVCNKHGDFNITPSHHFNGVGCSKCSKNYNQTNLEYIEDVSKKHNNFYDYSLVEYINNKSDILIICPIHGTFSQNAHHHKNGSKCPHCNESKGENIIMNFMKDNKIKYIRQHKFDDCRNIKVLPFDFYLPDYNTCIEFDGRQHFESINYFGGYESLIKTRKRDQIKNNYCYNNNIKLIRIKYDEDIKKYLENYFS